VIEVVETSRPAAADRAADESVLYRGPKILQDGENAAVLFG
jgi:hypothetical protein